MNVTGYFGQKQGNHCGQSQRNTDNTVNHLKLGANTCNMTRGSDELGFSSDWMKK